MSQVICRQIVFRRSIAESERTWWRAFSKSCRHQRDQNGRPDRLEGYKRRDRKPVVWNAQTATEGDSQTDQVPYYRRYVHAKATRSKEGNSGNDSESIYDTQVIVGVKKRNFSSVLLRDLCECPACVDPSTKQKLFSTTDIPARIHASSVAPVGPGVDIRWISDIPGYGADHVTHLPYNLLRKIHRSGDVTENHHYYTPGPRVPWDAQAYSELADIEYDAYMKDDAVLFQAIQQLHTYGLMFLRNVPEDEKSVSRIGERIGPLKNTFYGYTWDVRSVPQAKNVAYTSQNLGFHMDLMYMHQPPQIQLLHCIRSSRNGGASLFADTYAAAAFLFASDIHAFRTLAEGDVNFHYNHPTTHLYRQSRRVFDLRPLQYGALSMLRIDKFKHWYETGEFPEKGKQYVTIPPKKPMNILDYLDAVNWSPPFQAPFTLGHEYVLGSMSAEELLSKRVKAWHEAAQRFSQLIDRPEGIYERLMRPGECVIFDNRRVLHARKAFAVEGASAARYLKGAYLDRDPFLSRMRVLARQQQTSKRGVKDVEEREPEDEASTIIAN